MAATQRTDISGRLLLMVLATVIGQVAAIHS